jgi:hypothetical protein
MAGWVIPFCSAEPRLLAADEEVGRSIVLVVGSSFRRFEVTHLGAEHGPDRFEELCYEIGRELARRKHQLVVLSESQEHSDPEVFRGYVEEAAQNTITVPPVKVSYGALKDPEILSAKSLPKYVTASRRFLSKTSRQKAIAPSIELH